MSIHKERVVSTNEKQFLLDALKLDLRTDGRNKSTSRPYNIKFGSNTGDVEVEVGNTRIIAGVCAEIVEPFIEKPNDGFLLFNVDFSSMASPYFDSTRPSLRSIEISRIIERCVKESGAIDTETLCLISGSKVWSIRVDIKAINAEGNLVDACCTAAIAALRYFRRPDVTVLGNIVTLHPADSKHPVELRFHHVPFTTTFCFYKDEESNVHVLVDPSLAEELCADAHLTIATNILREVCCMHKGGGLAVKQSTLMKCIELSHQRTEELTALLKAQLDDKFAELFKTKSRAEYASKYKLPSAGNKTTSVTEEIAQMNIE